MDREHIVQAVTVEICGERHTAVYFIENGIIHASIGDEDYCLPIAEANAAETVRAHLREIKNRDFKTEMSRKWFGQ